MGLPRSKCVQEDQEGVYHCFCRCVRRAYLYGVDAVTNQDFSHRKAWIVDRMKYLATIFAVEVCAYAIMSNHYHNILRTRPDIVASWSDREVVTRWLELCPQKPRSKKKPLPPMEDQISALLSSPKRVAELRKRLCSLSWFMGRLNEFIARAANKEDKVKGRFWESRFKCQSLLDDIAIIACMAYVDLNPIRAGLAATPEESDFTSIQERIRAWQRENMAAGLPQPSQNIQQNTVRISTTSSEETSSRNQSHSDSWLGSVFSDSQHRGMLDMTQEQYFDLVDQSGRALRSGKRGAINPDLEPILLRIGAKPEAWLDTVSHFGSKFSLAAGRHKNLQNFADKLGRRWLTGLTMARASFI